MIRQRIREQHVDYFRQLEPPRPYRKVEADPRVWAPRSELKQVFGNPELTRQPTEEQQLLPIEAALRPQYAGRLREVQVEPYGKLEVVHGDIFATQASAVILPMAPNLMPYRGLGLEAFDRGGRDLVRQTFAAAQKECAPMEEGKGLQAGDVLQVEGLGVEADNILFVIMPWFWQGSPMDAGKRFRLCVQQALLRAASAGGFDSVAMPHIGGGIYGYEPKSSAQTLLEEAMEALLQIEAQVPSYNLKAISFVEHRRETADELHNALTEVAHRWLPEMRVTSAPEYWGRQTRRLVVLPDKPWFFQKRHKVKFKKYHGVKRRWRHNYIGNVKPWLWRPSRVDQPPPLMLQEETGDIAPREMQHKARPYYFRGVSHWLFPARRSGYHALRKSSGGHWIGRPAPKGRPDLVEQVRPRM